MRQLALIALLAVAIPAQAQHSSSSYTDPWQVHAYELMRDSIAYRTVRGEKQVVPFTEFLAGRFLDGGFAAEDVHLLPMDSDGEPSASLVVRYRGTSGKKPILFAAHTDVVPATGEDWGRDPFVLSEEDGFFYGRGVLDDKFGTTVLTSTFLRLKREGYVPERDLIIAFTGDEESRQETIQALVRDHSDLIAAAFAFNVDTGVGLLDEASEPVALNFQYAEKNYTTFEITARSPGGHSSKPRPDNAIFDLANAIKAIQTSVFPVQKSAAVRDYFAAMGTIVGGETGAVMRRFSDNPDDPDAVEALSNDPDFVGVIRTTCVPTLLHGGHSENALPESATVTVNCRVFPGVPIDDVEARLVVAIANPDIEFKRTWNPKPSVASPIRPDVLAMVQAIVDKRHPGVAVIPYMGAGATDGKFLRLGGITTYGLMGIFLRAGDDLKHSSNEKLPVNGFYEALDFWYDLIQQSASL